MTATSDFGRTGMLARLVDESFDVLVVGGGITGAGAALDAATRGLRTALIEATDYAAGTSSKSSKLVHGGLRYLQQGEIRLVYEALHERQRLRRNAAHLVEVLPFMIPILTKDGVVSKRIARAFGSALWMYDLTGGWRIGKWHRRLRADAAISHMPTMPRHKLASAYLYFDATVDDARLCLTVARTAADHGAVVVNGARLTSLIKHTIGATTGQVQGAIVEVDGQLITVRARAVVNATGVWSDTVRTIDEGSDPDMIRPAKGIHLALPWDRVRNDIAVVIPVPKDKRSLFVVPSGPRLDGTFQHTYVGTTDTDYDGPLDNPLCTDDDIAYVLNALNASITEPVTADDVTGTWAGLRPLVKGAGKTKDLSRRHSVTTSASGVVTVTGGKMTTYRAMAEDTIDAVVKRLRDLPDVTLPATARRTKTRRLRLHGVPSSRFKLDRDDRLVGRYGTDATVVRQLQHEHPNLAEPLVPGLAYTKAEAVYAVRFEQARTLDDVLSRRTRARIFDVQATIDAAPAVARLIGDELGWNDAQIAEHTDAFVAACRDQHATVTQPM